MPGKGKIRVVGFDPSLRNWGIAIGSVIPGKPESLLLERVGIINPALPKGKQVRQNSLDLEAAKQLCAGAIIAAHEADAIFVEVPVGSQSSRAMASYGICVGVLGSLRATGIPLFEVTPTEVKLAGAGKVSASKIEMIDWAVNKHPEVSWPTYVQKGKLLITTSIAEHEADAVAAIYAGMACSSFQQMLSFLRKQI
jgi:Holliday junction resolvasome RuvABC endonuclease subunit